MDIDYVVPMVFDDDVLWQKAFCQSRHLLRYSVGSNVRFRSWGLEQLLVRCIRKFMPFVRTIYIILSHESQKKPWMNDEGIRVVYHDSIIPKQYLPCFNSCTIEMYVPFIRRLSEHFIYANDDMFPVSPMAVSDFFRNGLPVQQLKERSFPESMNIFHAKCKKQQDLVSGAFGINLGYKWLHNGHGLSPLLKSSCIEARKRFDAEITKGITFSRSETSYNQYLYVIWQYFTGKYVSGRATTTYLSVKNQIQYVEDTLRQARGIVCINDNECVHDIKGYADAVKKVLEERL